MVICCLSQSVVELLLWVLASLQIILGKFFKEHDCFDIFLAYAEMIYFSMLYGLLGWITASFGTSILTAQVVLLRK